MPVLVGTSGWQYAHWRERFYPRGVAQARWLEWYADRFATVESNAAFYRLPEAATFAAWAERTPDDFVMAVKASRYLTHIKRLKDPEEPVERLLGLRNDVGLLSEEYDTRLGRLVGNFPQAFSHVPLVSTAMNLGSGRHPVTQRSRAR